MNTLLIITDPPLSLQYLQSLQHFQNTSTGHPEDIFERNNTVRGRSIGHIHDKYMTNYVPRTELALVSNIRSRKHTISNELSLVR